MTTTSDDLEAGAIAPPGVLVPAGEHEMFVIDQGDGRPTVFLHGGGPGSSGWTDFGPVVPYFGGRRLVLFDLLQYGRSSIVANPGRRWDFQAEHLVLALDALGIEQADFVCSSVGGSVALALASTHPDRVGALVITGSQPTAVVPMAAPLAPGQLRIGPQAIRDLYDGDGPDLDKMRALVELEWLDHSKIPPATLQLRLAQARHPTLLAWKGHLAPHARGADQDLTEALPSITAPVLLIWGRHDPFLPPEYALHLASLLPDADVYVMDRAGHHLQEERPREYSAAVLGFLGR